MNMIKSKEMFSVHVASVLIVVIRLRRNDCMDVIIIITVVDYIFFPIILGEKCTRTIYSLFT